MSQPQARKPILWLGAHKTGTTFLQKSLMLSQEALAHHGLRYMDLDEFRAKYTRPLLYGRGFGRAPEPDENLNLIFDENIPGLVQHALSAKGLYPDIAARSRKVCAHFGLHDPDIYFGVRNYVGFLPSLYCEALKSTPYRPFDQFYRAGRHRIDWNNVLDQLRQAFPNSRIYVYFYEDLRGNEAHLLSRITGVAESSFVIPEKISRPGFSHAAVESLFELSKSGPVTRKDVFSAISRYRKGKKFPSYQPFDQYSISDLGAQYQEHVERMRLRDDVARMELPRYER